MTGLAAAGVYESLRHPWLLALGAAAILCAVALALAGLAPFDRLLAVMDGPWLAAVEHRNGFVFLANWTERDWANLVAQASVVLAAILASRGPLRRFLLSVLIAAMAGLAASAIGADLLRDVLIIQLQPWRAAWLLAWASVLSLFVLAPEARGPADWAFPALFAVAVAFACDAWPLGALGPIGLFGLARGYILPVWVANAIIALCALAFAVFLFSQIRFAFVVFRILSPFGLEAWSQAYFRAALALMAAPVFILAMIRYPAALPALAGVLFVLAAASWDQRTAWQKFIMDGKADAAAPAPVLWGDDATPTWFLLRSPAWLSLHQASGLLFSRTTALTWEARLRQARGIVRATAWRPAQPRLTCAEADPAVSAIDLRSICAGPDHPGAVILDRPTAGPPSTVFTTPVDQVSICWAQNGLQVRRSRLFHVYRCGG